MVCEQRIVDVIEQAVEEHLPHWSAVKAIKPVRLETETGAKEQHRHTDWKVRDVRRAPYLGRPMSGIMSLSKGTRLVVWPKDAGFDAANECQCICNKATGSICQGNPAGGVVVELGVGDLIIFLGDLLHAGAAAWPGCEENFRIHVYLRPVDWKADPEGGTWPC